MTYDYLVIKAEQLQGFESWLNKMRLRTIFREALVKSQLEYSYEPDEELGDLVYLQFTKPESWEMSIFTSVLDEIVKYDGNSWWTVSTGKYEWYFDEKTRKVVAQNEEAAKFLEEITLKTYHNSSYGYYLDYPPSWVINDEGESNVIISNDPKAVRALFSIRVIGKLTTYESLQMYLTERLNSIRSQCYEFEITKTTSTRADFIYREKKDSYSFEARCYLVQYESKVYEIICSGELSVSGGDYSNLYDPFESFRFQP